jgi:hypothetical protein
MPALASNAAHSRCPRNFDFLSSDFIPPRRIRQISRVANRQPILVGPLCGDPEIAELRIERAPEGRPRSAALDVGG